MEIPLLKCLYKATAVQNLNKQEETINGNWRGNKEVSYIQKHYAGRNGGSITCDTAGYFKMGNGGLRYNSDKLKKAL